MLRLSTLVLVCLSGADRPDGPDPKGDRESVAG